MQVLNKINFTVESISKNVIVLLFSIFILSITVTLAQSFPDTEIIGFDDIGNFEFHSSALFNSEDLIELQLSMDTRTVRRDVGEEPSYHKAILSYMLDNKIVYSVNVKVKARGNFRKASCNCNFPPLKIKFHECAQNTLFESQRKLKLVTHCQNNKDRYEQYTLNEYLIYKSYNLITDKSYKVRLAKITYIDIAGRDEVLTKYAFFIESTKELARRMGGKEIEVKGITMNHTAAKQTAQLSLFQYMIGNTDWSISGLHNVKMIAFATKQLPIVVPYDFDWSGIILADYAVPSIKLNITSVRERVYRGYYKNEKVLNSAINDFKANKNKIYNLYSDFQYLTLKSKKTSLKYLNEFFKTIENSKILDYEICNSNKISL